MTRITKKGKYRFMEILELLCKTAWKYDFNYKKTKNIKFLLKNYENWKIRAIEVPNEEKYPVKSG